MRSHREAAQAAGLAWSHAALASVADAERILAPLAGEATHLAPIADEDLRRAVVEIAHRHRMLTFGGHAKTLMGYSRYFSDVPRRIAAVLDQVLRGADPAGIPFELPDRTHLRLNRATARLVGVEFPSDMLLRATRVVDSRAAGPRLRLGSWSPLSGSRGACAGHVVGYLTGGARCDELAVPPDVPLRDTELVD